MKRNIFKLILTVVMMIFTVFLTSCEEEEVDHVSVVTLQRHEEEYIIGQFNYENYSFMVQYDDGTKKEIFLTEDMLSSYDKMSLLQEGKHTLQASILGKTIEIEVEAVSKEITGVTFKDVNGVYNGQPYTIEIEGTIPAGATVEYFPKNTFTEAGTYDVEAVISCDNYKTLHLTAIVYIEKATYDLSSFTFEDYETPYNGEYQKLEIIGKMPEGLTYYYTYSTKPEPLDTDIKANSAITAGTYYITLHISGDKANYYTDNLTITKKLIITKKEIVLDTKEISMKDMQVEYDGNYHSITLNEDKLPENVSVEYFNNNQINAGEYEIKAVFSLKDSVNYKIVNSLTAKLTITKTDYDMSGITLPDATFDYDGNTHSLSYDGTLPRGVELYYYENNDQYQAGEYEVKAFFKINDNNHNSVQPITGKLTINKGSFTTTSLSLEGGSFTYDGSYREVKLIGELPAGVQVTYKSWNEKATDLGNTIKFKDVGTYTIVATFKFEKENYSEYVDIADATTTITISKREFNDENQLPIEDLTYTYDGTNHGTSKDINLPSWTVMKSFTLLDSKGIPTEEAVNVGQYYYYYTYEYYNGVETIIENSRTASITINKFIVQPTINFTVLPSVTKEYDGNVYASNITFIDVPDEEVLLNATSVSVKKENNEYVENAINAGKYTVIYSFTDTQNYEFTVASVSTSLVIEKKMITVNEDTFKVEDVTVDYDGTTHYPNVTAQPEHTVVEYTLTSSSQQGKYNVYQVSLNPESDNYDLSNTNWGLYSVTTNAAQLTIDNSGVELDDQDATYTTSTYASRNYKNVEQTALDVDTSYVGGLLQTYTIDANGSIRHITSLFGKDFAEISDLVILSDCKLVYARNDGIIFELATFDSLDDVNNYTLFINSDNRVNFESLKGTPYGTYILYYTLSSYDSMINIANNKFVCEINVEKQTFDPSTYFVNQDQLWVSEIDNPTPYVYDLSKLGDLPTGVSVDVNQSTLNRSYSTSNLTIRYLLNINMFGIESGNYTPVIVIKDRTYDLSKMSIRYSTIIYDATNHQHNWTDVSKIVNMNSELAELIEQGVVTISYDTLNGQQAVTPGSYEVVATFTSSNSHLIVTNTALAGSEAKINSVIIIQKKMVTEDQIEAAVKQAVIDRTNGTGDAGEDNVCVSTDYVEKEDRYQKTFVYTNTVSDDFVTNMIKFTRGESTGRYNTPVAGMNLVSIERTNERGDIVYDTTYDNIYVRSCDTREDYIDSLMNTPIKHEYYVLHYAFDEYTSLQDTNITTYDVYIRSDSVALYVKPENQSVAYSGNDITLVMEHQDDISKLVNFKYVNEYGTVTTNPSSFSQIGSYDLGIKVYCYNENSENVLIGTIERELEITKILISKTYLDDYLYKTIEWDGESHSIFETREGFKLPDHVVTVDYTVDGETIDVAPVYSDICAHDIEINFTVDDSEHYELASNQVTLSYRFEIVKAKVEADLCINDTVINDTNKCAYLNDTGTVEYKINSNFANVATVQYRKCLTTGDITAFQFADSINITTKGIYIVQVKVNVNNSYLDKVELGRYVNGTFVSYTFDSDMCYTYENVVLIDKIDLSRVNMTFEDNQITKAFEAKVKYGTSSTMLNVVFGEVTVRYSSDGYIFSFDSNNYYEVSTTIAICKKLDGDSTISTDSISIRGANTFRLNNEMLVPGDYYIVFGHNTTIAGNNNYYANCEYDTYLGIHLIIN